MSKTVAQIFATNPSTTILDDDLIYMVQSPYTPGTDTAILGSNVKAIFLQSANNLSDLSNPAAARANLGLTAIASAVPPLSGTLGGTGVNNGASTITIGGNVTFSGAFTFAGTLTGNTAVTFPTSGTLATTAQLPSLPLSLADGGTGASLIASNGGIFYSNATTGAILAGTATAGQIIRSGANAAPSWSTATYPSAAGTSGNVLTSDGTNWNSTAPASSGIVNPGLANQLGYYATSSSTISGLTSANNGLLVTSAAGVPSILAGPGTTGNVLQSNAAGAPSFSTATYPSTALNAARILRSDGTNWVETTSTFADTYAASSLLYANGSNNVAGLATANNGTLVTSAAGIPSILVGPGTTGNFLQSNAAAAPSWSTSTITLGGNFAMSGAFTFTGTVTGNTAVTFPTSGTLATTAQLLTSPLTTKGDIWVWSTTNDRLPVATGDGKILQVSSGAATGLAYSTATYPTVATSTGSFLYANGTNYVASTSLWPNTVGATGKIVISDGTSNVYSTPTYPNAAGTAGNVITSNGTNFTSAALPNLGQVLQVVQTVDTTNRSTTSASFVTSSVAVSITPATTSSRIRIQIEGLAGNSTAGPTINSYTLYRDATPLTPAGVTQMAAAYVSLNTSFEMFSLDFIDSPATVSSVTYTLYFATAAGTTYLGRRGSDTTIDAPTVITATELRS